MFENPVTGPPVRDNAGERRFSPGPVIDAATWPWATPLPALVLRFKFVGARHGYDFTAYRTAHFVLQFRVEYPVVFTVLFILVLMFTGTFCDWHKFSLINKWLNMAGCCDMDKPAIAPSIAVFNVVSVIHFWLAQIDTFCIPRMPPCLHAWANPPSCMAYDNSTVISAGQGRSGWFVGVCFDVVFDLAASYQMGIKAVNQKITS